MATRVPIDLIVSVTPAAGITMRCPENVSRIRAYNKSNQWVHITAPIDEYVAPGVMGASYTIVAPTAGFLTLTALFEAPGGWTQAGAVANQKCTLSVEDDGSSFAGDSPGVLSITPSVYAEHFEDDVDAAHPYTARFYIPSTIALAKALLLSYLALPYRYYVSASSSSSSSSSLSATDTISQTVMSSGGDAGHTHDSHGNGASFTATNNHASDATATATTTDAQGVHNHGTNAVSDTEYASHDHATGVFSFITGSPHSHLSTNDGSHSHNVNSHSHGHAHAAHGFGGTHNTYQHDHTIGHSHTTNGHSHTISTTTTTTLSPGVLEELTAGSWTLAVDGNAVAAPPLNATDLDVFPYVTKDASGNPAAGWHTIKWTPNQRSRLQADLIVQIYVSAF